MVVFILVPSVLYKERSEPFLWIWGLISNLSGQVWFWVKTKPVNFLIVYGYQYKMS